MNARHPTEGQNQEKEERQGEVPLTGGPPPIHAGNWEWNFAD